MKKKLLALLLAALMIVSIFPVSALAEGEVEGNTPEQSDVIVVEQDPTVLAANTILATGGLTETEPDDVHDALDTAIGSELDAAGEYSALSPNRWEEMAAAGNDAAADQRLTNAEGVTGFSDGFTDFLADRAEDHADNAQQDLADATDAADRAGAAAADADAALQDAENAYYKGQAQLAADAAQDASVAAQKAASEALAAAQDAAAEAERAQNDYLIAQAAYDAAKAEVDRQLAQGLIDAQTAEALTADVAAKADAAYNTMVAAQAAAEQAVSDAKAAADAADAELQNKLDALEEAIATNAANVAQKTGVTVLTGAALAAAKIAAEATKLQVSYYEGQIESKQAEIDELEQKIADAQTAIDEAQAEVDRLKGELDAAADDYEQKAKELEEAETALAAAQSVVDNLTAIVEERQNATTAGVADAIAAVKNGSATTDQKKAIAEYVLGNASKYDSSATDVTIKERITDEVFAVENGDGSVSYYKVVTEEVMGKDEQENDVVTDRYLQFVQVEESYEEELSATPDAKQTYQGISGSSSSNTKTTNLIAREGENEYQIVVVKSGNKYSFKVRYSATGLVYNNYDLKVDNGQFYFVYGVGSLGVTHNITLIKPLDEPVYTEVENGLSGSSKIVSDQWDAADSAEQNLSDAQTAQEAAAQAAQDALDTKNTAQNAYDAARETLNNFKAGQEADKQQLTELQSEMKELDKKLNGSIAEQLARVFFDEGLSGVADVLANAEVPVEALSEEDQARYAELEEQIADLQEQYDSASGLARIAIGAQLLDAQTKRAGLAVKAGAAVTQDAVEQGQALYELYSTLADGEYNLDDVSAVVELLTGTGLSAKTKEFIMDKIVDVLEGIHENAVEALKEAVEKGIEEVAAATGDAAEAALNAASAHAALEIAEAAKALADTLAADAADKKAAADQAAADAKLARELYEALMENYGPTDENVQRAKEAAEAAEEYAALAAAEAERAQEAADRAKADYEKAQEIADSLPTLGELIARYAWSLKEDGYAKLVNDESKLNSKDFVDHVYSHFGVKLNLDGSISEIGGVQVDNDARYSGDVIAKTDDGRFGVNFGLDGIDGFVEFDEATGAVVMTGFDGLSDYGTVRVVWG